MKTDSMHAARIRLAAFLHGSTVGWKCDRFGGEVGSEQSCGDDGDPCDSCNFIWDVDSAIGELASDASKETLDAKAMDIEREVVRLMRMDDAAVILRIAPSDN